ncbi:type I-D CRISPR-associated protein Cas7/Csc2 [Pseudanabaena galeata UHCC 0370]|uniref:Type I-D CRISPR-associated protein Cas7/Csc2 n=1 Tax=Pseudanabaena galeata UHCC 0370 TaxID=3110310 RepID=A0ABU5TNY1_9CYAN|nr:type I-D CRISPR-associated protein Cas7/Csc2 [Pseudanabaena galeata]MEA5480053.1 type I-D CRISPR-associated protein Cas7/Csc2 [Pseudanabaena galeata UHCC 0370]
MFDKYSTHFQSSIPRIPEAKYAHIVVLRETDSYAVFKTDGELNVARVRSGLKESKVISRLVLFKRKQTTPERLTGRELLRRYGIYEYITTRYERAKESKDKAIKDCTYNENPCGACPDCVIYGYAIGETGSEKSKIFIDSAYAIPSYEESHGTFTLNAPYEDGTMTSGTTTTNRFSEQDHVLPEVPFPSVVTLRDPSSNSFLYVLNNLYRTKRYGAQTTRTGQVRNKIVAVIFADGEIFSNLRLTQKLHDLLGDARLPYEPDVLKSKTEEAISSLIKEDGVLYELVIGEPLAALQNEAEAILSDETAFKAWLNELSQETLTYAEASKVIKKK